MKKSTIQNDAHSSSRPETAVGGKGWKSGLSTAALLLIMVLLLTLTPAIRMRIRARVTSARGQAEAAKLVHAVLAGRYRFYHVDRNMIWHNGQQINPAHITLDFLSCVVIRTNSPVLLIFARFDQLGPEAPPAFDISIDGGAGKTVPWRSVLTPQSISLGTTGEHTIVIRANPLRYNEINAPFPLKQNVITEFAVPAKYEIDMMSEPGQHHTLVTVTDSLGQGYGTPDPAHDAWTARLADSGRWPGVVMNRGFVGERLADLCNSAASCDSFADSLVRDFPNAAAYYFALGTNDFGGQQECTPSGAFAEDLSGLLQELHKHNPQAGLYLQTPLHRADEARQNACGNTLSQFRDAEQRMAQNLSWITLIDGFSEPFPQLTSASSVFVDPAHLTARGQQQYFLAVLGNLRVPPSVGALPQASLEEGR